MKYQFSIRVKKKGDQNSAASKAVMDCNVLFHRRGYKPYNLVFDEGDNKLKYYGSIIKSLFSFYFTIKKNSIVGVQYPMLNNIFKYFIKAAKGKNIKFFCIIHDIESLRLGGKDEALNRKEAANLNYYDCIIVHNNKMSHWLQEKGVTTTMIPLGVFDYLTDTSAPNSNEAFTKTIAFAGNLTKSAFVYSLSSISNWNFNLYGPNLKKDSIRGTNTSWGGEFTPERVVNELKGDFGLIWDGTSTSKCDEILGNYLKYNNPHKFSLYLAAGLPVIATANAAIGDLIKEKNLGLLVQSLDELQHIEIDEENYQKMKSNCVEMSKAVTSGQYFLAALDKVESALGVAG